MQTSKQTTLGDTEGKSPSVCTPRGTGFLRFSSERTQDRRRRSQCLYSELNKPREARTVSPRNRAVTSESHKLETATGSPKSILGLTPDVTFLPGTRRAGMFIKVTSPTAVENSPLIVTRSYDPLQDSSLGQNFEAKQQVQRSYLTVKRGDILKAIRVQDGRLLTQSFLGRFGYVPLDCVAPITQVVCSRVRSQDFSQQFPDENYYHDIDQLATTSHSDSGIGGDLSPCRELQDSIDSSSIAGDLSTLADLKRRPPRLRNPVLPSDVNLAADKVESSGTQSPRLTVLFDYSPSYSGDIQVREHEVVILLDRENNDWLLVKTLSGVRGYIPKGYAINLSDFNLDPSAKTTYL